jgi:hypothetical protein
MSDSRNFSFTYLKITNGWTGVFCVSEKDQITKGDVSKKFGEPENHGDNIAFNVFYLPINT